MSKETFYFSHDYNARNDIKIQALLVEHGAAGYGVYWIIVETLHEESGKKLKLNNLTYVAIARQASTSVEQVKAIVECCLEYELLTEDDGRFYSERVLNNIGKRIEISEKRAKAGRISAEKRKKATLVEKNSTSVEESSTKSNKGKERKEKESKGKNSKDINNNNDSIKREKNAHYVYQENFGTESSIVAQQIEYWIGDLSEELVIEAMKRAVINNVRKFSYVESILKDWDNKGFRSLADVKAGDVDRELAKGGLSNLADDEDFEPVPMINWLKDLDN